MIRGLLAKAVINKGDLADRPKRLILLQLEHFYRLAFLVCPSF